VDHSKVFVTETVSACQVPTALQRAATEVTKTVRAHMGTLHLLQRMVLDFEACLDVTVSKKSHVVNSAAAYKAKLAVNEDQSANHKTHRGHHASGGSTAPAGGTSGTGGASAATAATAAAHAVDHVLQWVPAPHMLDDVNDPSISYKYRLIHIAETEFHACLSGLRRNAVHQIAPTEKVCFLNIVPLYCEVSC
jgi:hypothetical protein